MSAAPHLTLEVEQDQDYLVSESIEQCRFCHCTEDRCCEIYFREDEQGNFRLARRPEDAVIMISCSWYAPGVCNAPECVEKLLLEARGKVVLFDARGERAI
jgi:hypothetical protein